MPRITIAAALLFAVGVMFVPATQAAPVFFLLGDHPDGNLYDDTDPDTAYGLRMDSLDATFSVGTNLGGPGGPLFLTYDPDNLNGGAQIFGLIDRHFDDDNSEDGDGVNFFVNYTLFGLSAFGDGFRATGGNGTAVVDGACASDCDSFDLIGKQDDDGWAFIWDNNGFRLPGNTGWVGNGWLEGMKTNDWLVTGIPTDAPGEEVPEPGTIGLMLIGLGMLAGGRKFRNRKED